MKLKIKKVAILFPGLASRGTMDLDGIETVWHGNFEGDDYWIYRAEGTEKQTLTSLALLCYETPWGGRGRTDFLPHYLERGPITIIYKNKLPLAALHPATKTYVDSKDRFIKSPNSGAEISWEELKRLFDHIHDTRGFI